MLAGYVDTRSGCKHRSRRSLILHILTIGRNGLDKGSNETHQWKHPAGSKRDIFENTVLLVCWSALQLER